jgi:hypothetical protein
MSRPVITDNLKRNPGRVIAREPGAVSRAPAPRLMRCVDRLAFEVSFCLLCCHGIAFTQSQGSARTSSRSPVSLALALLTNYFPTAPLHLPGDEHADIETLDG